MNVGAGTGKLRHAMKTLRSKWDATEDEWRDHVREDFEQKRITPLEAQAAATLRAMHNLNEVLARAYRECS